VVEAPGHRLRLHAEGRTGLGDALPDCQRIDGKPFEVFATIGKSGRSITAKAEAIGRLVSLALRSGVDVERDRQAAQGHRRRAPGLPEKGLLLSIPDAVSWVLENRYMQGRKPSQPSQRPEQLPSAPNAARPLIFQEGCHVCQSCGYTKCG
jgi:ribonucleoside-diphosphate reductase alpha chain